MFRKVLSIFLAVIMMTGVIAVIPAAAEEIEQDGLTFRISGSQAYVSGYNGSSKNIVIPDTVNGYPVTGIDSYAFESVKSMSSVTVPDSVTSIGTKAIGYYIRYFTDYVNNVADSEETRLSPTIYGYTGSAAHIYAIVHNFSFSSLGQSTQDNPPEISAIDYEKIEYSSSKNKYYTNYLSAGASLMFRIRPTEDTTIEFYSNQNNGNSYYYPSDTYGSLYDERMNLIASDDDSNSKHYYNSEKDFYINYTLKAGKTYYFQARFYSSSTSGYLRMCFTEINPYEMKKNDDGTATLTRYMGGEAEFTIPEKIDGYRITEISPGAFRNNTALKKVIVPEYVSIIPYGAFEGCSNLSVVELNEGLLFLGGYAFLDCPKLKSIDLPYSLVSMGYYSFGYTSRKIVYSDNTGNTEYTKLSGITISGYDSSLAKIYADNNGITFVSKGKKGVDAFYLFKSLNLGDTVTVTEDPAYFRILLNEDATVEITSESSFNVKGVLYDSSFNEIGEIEKADDGINYSFKAELKQNTNYYLKTLVPTGLAADGKRVMELLGHSGELAKLLSSTGSKPSVLIGSEINNPALSNLSVIAFHYEANSECTGALALIGPVRMDYPRIVSSLEYVAGAEVFCWPLAVLRLSSRPFFWA